MKITKWLVTLSIVGFWATVIGVAVVTAKPTPRQEAIIQSPVASPQTNACIITIDGAKYDVTQFRKMHPGGDIFTCGTDMSQIFWSQHDQRMLNKMQAYRVN